jgi:hypothetical protein
VGWTASTAKPLEQENAPKESSPGISQPMMDFALAGGIKGGIGSPDYLSKLGIGGAQEAPVDEVPEQTAMGEIDEREARFYEMLAELQGKSFGLMNQRMADSQARAGVIAGRMGSSVGGGYGGAQAQQQLDNLRALDQHELDWGSMSLDAHQHYGNQTVSEFQRLDEQANENKYRNTAQFMDILDQADKLGLNVPPGKLMQALQEGPEAVQALFDEYENVNNRVSDYTDQALEMYDVESFDDLPAELRNAIRQAAEDPTNTEALAIIESYLDGSNPNAPKLREQEQITVYSDQLDEGSDGKTYTYPQSTQDKINKTRDMINGWKASQSADENRTIVLSALNETERNEWLDLEKKLTTGSIPPAEAEAALKRFEELTKQAILAARGA